MEKHFGVGGIVLMALMAVLIIVSLMGDRGSDQDNYENYLNDALDREAISMGEYFCARFPDVEERNARFRIREPGQIRMIAMGETVADAIGPSDMNIGNSREPSFVDRWGFVTCQEEFVIVEMQSEQIDPQILLASQQHPGKDNKMIDVDDDSGDGLDSRIAMKLQPGFYWVFAMSHSTIPRFGDYTISISVR